MGLGAPCQAWRAVGERAVLGLLEDFLRHPAAHQQRGSPAAQPTKVELGREPLIWLVALQKGPASRHKMVVTTF